MATNQVGNTKAAAIAKKLKLEHVAKPDSSATAAMKELAQGNRKEGSISGQEMMDAIIKGTKDFDNHSASSEFAAISKFVQQNGKLLSPEAKKVFASYEKAAHKAQRAGQSGIDFRDYQAMQREMRSLATVKSQDAGAGRTIRELAKENTRPGSISGKEFADAIVSATKDHDNQGAGKEYADLAKFVKENEHLLSPEAKKAWGVYEKAVKAAKAQGQTGIAPDKFARMVRDMMRAIAPPATPAPQPATPAPAPAAPAPAAPAPVAPAPVAPAPAPVAPPVAPPPSAGVPPPAYGGGVPPPPMAGVPSAEQGGEQANFSIPIYGQPQQPAPVVTTPTPTTPTTPTVPTTPTTPTVPVPTAPVTDASLTAALAELDKANTKPGSISGKEFTDAVIKGTRDLDNSSAGAEFAQLQKWVKDNGAKMSPEAKAAWAVYEKTAKGYAAKGQTGIPLGEFNKMAKAMSAVSTPKYTDRTSKAALDALAKGNTTPGSISSKELTDAIVKGTRDPDNQAAGREYKDIAKFVRENEHLLSPEAKKAFATYEKYAQAAQKKGDSGIKLGDYNKMVKEMRGLEKKPVIHDASATQALDALGKANTRPGSISGEEFTKSVINGTKDLDNQSAGREFQDVAAWVKQNGAKLSPEAKAAFAVYEKHAKAHAKKGETGIPLPEFNKMEKEMLAVSKPKYQDRSTAGALNALAAGNKTPGSISAKELADAVFKGARDPDNQAAGKEYADIAKFVRENEQLLSPEAKKAFAVYEKHARAAKGNDQTGIPLPQFDAMIREMRAFEPKPLH